MLLRYASWYGLARVALRTAWDASAQAAVGQGRLAASLLMGSDYLALCWRARHGALARGGLT